MIDPKQADKLRRACRKERKCFETLCDEKDNVGDNCEAYLKARNTRKKICDQVESA
jgi:hypothetical protein